MNSTTSEEPDAKAAAGEPAARAPEDFDEAATPSLSLRRFCALYVLPLLALLAWVALPLARGAETLYLRDVLNTHLEMKWAEAVAFWQGYLPILDPWRAGGQPLAGNPNAAPFYPTSALHLLSSPIWALNAHFWIHLLLAPFAFYWMARRIGLRREPAWAAAACYTLSGFFLSHLSFYNLIAGAALAPALVAACLTLAAAGRAGAAAAPAVALLWGLLLLGGDPLMALLAAGLALGAVLASPRAPGLRRRGILALLAAAFSCGTLIALPQIVEFLRILPVSFRGYWGYDQLVATVASWDPRQIAEWLLPTLFGRLDRIGLGTFWGEPYFTGTPPYYPSLYPGLLALALIAAAGWPRRRARPALFALAAIAAGLFFSLGRFNPLFAWLARLPGHAALRYPVKFWLPVALGAALLCGLGFERLLGAPDSAGPDKAWLRLRLALLALGGIFAVAWAYLTLRAGPALALLRRIIPLSFPPVFVANERLRWASLCLMSLLIVAALLVASSRSVRRNGKAATAGALLLGVHALAQLLLLRPLYPTDAMAPYLVPPPALAFVPAEERVVNPDFKHLFGPSHLKSGRFPDQRALWLERRAFFELYAFTGPLWQRHFELNESAEGLDSFLTRMAEGSLKSATNEQRLRLLAAWGVGRLILDRPLDPQPATARLLARIPSFGQTLYVYEVLGRSPEVMLARRVFHAPHVNAARAWLINPVFSPETDAVIPGSGPPRALGGGRARITRSGPEAVEIDAEAAPPGAILVLQRADLLYRATIDNRPAPVLAANLHRVGLELPPGRHHIRFWVDRTALHRSLWCAAGGVAALPVLGFVAAAWRRRSRVGRGP